MGRVWDFAKYGNTTALIGDNGVRLSYPELSLLEGRLSGLMEKRALILMFCKNTPGAVAGYAALLNNGFPVMPVSSELPADLRNDIINTYRPAFIFLPEDMCSDYPHMKRADTVLDYVILNSNYTNPFPVYDDLALLITTSGSTGSVKFVRQSFDNIIFNSNAIAGYLGLVPSDVSVTTLPMQYTYGITMINVCFSIGACVAVTRKSFLEEEFWDFFEEAKCTCFHGVPNTYEILYKLGLFEEDWEDLRILTQAGGKLGKNLQAYYADYARKHGKQFVIMYGQSEATAAISYLYAQKEPERPGSAGTVIENGRITLRDGDRIIDEPFIPGELCYEGKNAALGYSLGGEDLIKGDEWKGFIRTGDIAKRDEDGFYYITGRLKRYIKMSGHSISLDEIDERIMESLHINSVSSGIDDHLVIFVTGQEEKEAVLRYIRQSMTFIHHGCIVESIPEFPVNESGKVLYGELYKTALKLSGIQIE